MFYVSLLMFLKVTNGLNWMYELPAANQTAIQGTFKKLNLYAMHTLPAAPYATQVCAVFN